MEKNLNYFYMINVLFVGYKFPGLTGNRYFCLVISSTQFSLVSQISQYKIAHTVIYNFNHPYTGGAITAINNAFNLHMGMQVL